MALVFQYGSNTSSSRLNSDDRLRGAAKSLGLAITVGQYDLGFTVWSNGSACAAADLVRGYGRHVWGVLYEMPDHLLARETAGNRRSLDAIEGCRYRRRRIRIRKPDISDMPLTVWTYTVITKQGDLMTSREYVSHILKGLREHDAPLEYIDRVRSRIVKNNPGLTGQI